ncbi:MAG: acyl-CoA thioesterase [Candidatus Omnitrophica bacterium]|nr:acyl-CoA thioesterase [Candidatus Omnitrophota bacterium]
MNYFDYKYRVRYGDTDKMGISYYANYLVWFEAARTEFFRALGLPYTECEKQGYYLPVVEANIQYLRPSTYDDLLTVRTSVAELGRSRMRFEYQVFDSKMIHVIASGFTAHVFVDSKMKPQRVPDVVKKIVTPFILLT